MSISTMVIAYNTHKFNQITVYYPKLFVAGAVMECLDIARILFP